MGATGTGRRHNRLVAEAPKREIVAASFAPDSSVSSVARHYGRECEPGIKSYRDELGAGAALAAPQLMPVPF